MSSHTPKRPLNARLARYARYRTGRERTIAAPKHAAHISVNRRCHLGSSIYELGGECHFGNTTRIVVERFRYALVDLELWRNDRRRTETRHCLESILSLRLAGLTLGSMSLSKVAGMAMVVLWWYEIRSGACHVCAYLYLKERASFWGAIRIQI